MLAGATTASGSLLAGLSLVSIDCSLCGKQDCTEARHLSVLDAAIEKDQYSLQGGLPEAVLLLVADRSFS